MTKKDLQEKVLSLSVIIPAYNTAPFIRRCILSVISQSWPGELEILVCDDGSEDNTFQEIPALPGVSAIRNEKNLGISNSFNKLVEISKGEYLFFMGSDDYLSGNYFKFAYDYLMKGYDVVYTDMQIETNKGKRIGRSTLYLPIFHRKYLVTWDWPKNEYGHDIPQKRALGDAFDKKDVYNPSPDYHYIRWGKNHTTVCGQNKAKTGENVPKNEPIQTKTK